MRPKRILCVLDFYVHESYQRDGIGRHLFDAMLSHQNTSAEVLAYDRPSPKLLAFLRKHFALTNQLPQSNNFVVFPGPLQQSAVCMFMCQCACCSAPTVS